MLGLGSPQKYYYVLTSSFFQHDSSEGDLSLYLNRENKFNEDPFFKLSKADNQLLDGDNSNASGSWKQTDCLKKKHACQVK
jgi:hypothetical protein